MAMCSYKRNLLILVQIRDTNCSVDKYCFVVKSAFTLNYMKFLFLISAWSQETLNLLAVSPVLLHLLKPGNTVLCKQFHHINGAPDGAEWQI